MKVYQGYGSGSPVYTINSDRIYQGYGWGKQYSFDSFEVTKANIKAFELAKKFAENADAKPVALFDGTATGKTPLLYAVKNAIE